MLYAGNAGNAGNALGFHVHTGNTSGSRKAGNAWEFLVLLKSEN
jgi:hypothetical protein